MIDDKIKGYIAKDGVFVVSFAKFFCLFSAKSRIRICENSIMTSLTLTSEPWSKHSDVMLSPNEAAYRVLLPNGDEIWPNF